MLKSLHRIDRRTFWLWAIPIVCVHGLFAVAAVHNVKTSLGGVDTALIVVLALGLVCLFRDIGWPVWIGPIPAWHHTRYSDGHLLFHGQHWHCGFRIPS